MPLSTVQRRKASLERSSYIRKYYELDAKSFGWRTADLLISVEKGDSIEVANRLLSENFGNELAAGISKKTKDNMHGVRVTETSLRMGDPLVNVMARTIFRNSEELFHIMQEIKKMPNIVRVEWSEIVKVMGRNNALILFHSVM